MAEEASHQPDRGIEQLAAALAAATFPYTVGHVDPAGLGTALVPRLVSWARAAADRRAAEQLGRQLVAAGCVETKCLEMALPVLGDYLQRRLPGASGEVFSLLGAVAHGFSSAQQARTLHHQEQLHQALRRSRDAAEAALEEETRFVNAILDHIEALVVVATTDGTIIRFNRAAQRVTGFALDEIAAASSIVGRPLVTVDNLPGLLATISQLKTEPGAPPAVPMRTGIRTRSGEERQIDWMLTLLDDKYGQFTHYVASGIDVTANLQIEQELQEARRLLHERDSAMLRSLARALHDGPVQELLSLSHVVADMQTRAEADQLWTSQQRLEELIPALEIVRRKMLSVATRLRQSIAELRPPGLEEMGLYQAVEVLVHQNSDGLEGPGPDVILQIPESVDLLPEPTRTTLYFLTREALHNCQRHAKASSVTVRIQLEEETIHLLVRDDGCGFVVPDRLARLVHNQQYGLVGMEERVRLRGGRLEIDSEPGKGTTIRASIPIEPPRSLP